MRLTDITLLKKGKVVRSIFGCTEYVNQAEGLYALVKNTDGTTGHIRRFVSKKAFDEFVAVAYEVTEH